MTKRIAALSLIAAAALAGPALAQGEGGCNWGASHTSAQADAPQGTLLPVETTEERG